MYAQAILQIFCICDVNNPYLLSAHINHMQITMIVGQLGVNCYRFAEWPTQDI